MPACGHVTALVSPSVNDAAAVGMNYCWSYSYTFETMEAATAAVNEMKRLFQQREGRSVLSDARVRRGAVRWLRLGCGSSAVVRICPL